jgi:hypothetical protein
MRKLVLMTLALAAMLSAFSQGEEQKVDWIPDHALTEFAGGKGFLSVGFGYENRIKNLQFDFQLGHLPEQFAAGDDFWIITATGIYNLWNLVKDDFHFKPLRAGMHLNFSTGDDFFINSALEARYPQKYYWWSSAFRFNFFVGSEVTYQIDEKKRISAFYELGTNDLYLASYFHDDNYEVLSVSDILVLGIGVKFTWK